MIEYIKEFDRMDDLNRAMEYIEEHLTQTIDYQQLAIIANCPIYYFQRIFFFMTQMTLNEYIRKRRMSLAIADLQYTHNKIIDIAMKYGYESPTAFNRAFQSVHGCAPSLVRKCDVALKSYPMIKFNLSLQGDKPLEYKIVHKECFHIIGKSYPLSRNLLENFKHIPTKWDRAQACGMLNQLKVLNNQEPYAMLGISIHHNDDWRYMIGTSSTHKHCQFENYLIPQATWAVFSGHGTNKDLQELERRIIVEWLPTSGYQYAQIPDIEVYIQADPNDTIYEYWLPIIKKQGESL
ncbi:AraC family transcriptional regulator [Candidatus Stoquefichus sp. SB1]|uniref:AraC family transcriptional regulator n=1 Tax=Candidatus Stoquefichus sp. SB1 TaxID=1658109 RepID=UPI00067F1C97|nr:GyrI-like domain-containing protein [Candidatus Stoquefichus sp. SB1]